MADSEALLFVDDEEAEVAEDDVFREQAVGADGDVEGPAAHLAQQAGGLLRAPEPVERPDGHRVVGETLPEGARVLLDQHGGGGEHGDLPAVLDRLEGGANRHLGLAVSHVSADQPVHGRSRLHVPLDVFHHAPLIARVLVEERRFHLLLPAGVGRKGVTLGHLAAGVELEEFGGDLADGLLGAGTQILPALPADAVHRRRLCPLRAADPPLQQIEPVHGHAQELRARVFDQNRLDLLATDGDMLEPAKAADAVVHVHDRVPRGELRDALERSGAAKAAPPANAARAQEDLVVGEDAQARGRVVQDESRVQRPHGELGARREARLPSQNLLQALNLPLVVAEDEGSVAAGGPVPQHFLQPLHVTGDGRRRLRGEENLAIRGRGEGQPGEVGQPLQQAPGPKTDGVRRRRLVSARDGFGMAALHLGPCVLRGSLQVVARPARHQGVLGQQVEQGAGRAGSVRTSAVAQPDREQTHLGDRPPGPLVQDVEAAHGNDFVTHELDAHRVGGTEGEDVHYAPAHRELTDFLHQRSLVETALPELLRQSGEPDLGARPQG